MPKIKVWHLFLLFICATAVAQAPKRMASTTIFHELQKLNFLGTALYVAAHPDDENTRMISYLSNEVKARTAYLSLTRGDGGQNLIGPELRELLGVLRTQELLAARSVDGGEQLFSRANDFGFSKHPKETLTIWNKDDVLHDVIWNIRKFRPDVIINRFDHRTPGTTHGHHTASAMLSEEAFDLVGNANIFPEQLKEVTVWQPKRLFFNTNWWFYGSRENFEKADKSNMTKVDVGVYYPNLGVSNNEIASLASSQHLCQGFGRITTRGSQDEYLELLKGDPTNGTNIFEGIDTSWSRIEGGKPIGDILYAVEANFNFQNPSIHLPDLINAYKLLQTVEDAHWRQLKTKELKAIILACSGIYVEAKTNTSSATPGEQVTLNIEALNRSKNQMTLKSVVVHGLNAQLKPMVTLAENKKQNLELEFRVPNTNGFTSPYWLDQEGSLGMYQVAEKGLIGKPESPVSFEVDFEIDFEGTAITFAKSLAHRFSKPDKGELLEPFVVLPKVTASFTEDVMLFADGKSKKVALAVRAGKDNVEGQVELKHPEGWEVQPSSIDFKLSQKGEVQTVYFNVKPSAVEGEGLLTPSIQVDGERYTKNLVEINYDHVPKQSILLPARTKVVRLDIRKNGENIGYIVGAGDKVPENLKQIGYAIETIDVASIEAGSLDAYDGIVLGIRAYNVVEELKFKQQFLLDYVKNGGNLIVQYNTAGRWRAQFKNIAPYPLTVSRDRVTDENAEVRFLAKDHPVLNSPNIINPTDFDGWVQERGLYFPNEWDEAFTPVLSMNDAGESPKDGSLLVAKYGKGNYIYTGLSFFRELPAGVPGAYKLFANMLSLEKNSAQP